MNADANRRVGPLLTIDAENVTRVDSHNIGRFIYHTVWIGDRNTFKTYKTFLDGPYVKVSTPALQDGKFQKGSVQVQYKNQKATLQSSFSLLIFRELAACSLHN